jgi:hypothetical protein
MTAIEQRIRKVQTEIQSIMEDAENSTVGRALLSGLDLIEIARQAEAGEPPGPLPGDVKP